MKIIPIPDNPISKFILLEKQIWEEMAKSFAVPRHLLKFNKVSTVREISLTSHSTLTAKSCRRSAKSL